MSLSFRITTRLVPELRRVRLEDASSEVVETLEYQKGLKGGLMGCRRSR